MPNRLTDVEVMEISLVTAPANQEAVVQLVKMHPDAYKDDEWWVSKGEPTAEDVHQGGGTCSHCGGKHKSDECMKKDGEHQNPDSGEGSSTVTATTSPEDTMPDVQIDKSKLDPEVVAHIEAMEKAAADKATEVEALTKSVTDLTAKVEELTKGGDEAEEEDEDMEKLLKSNPALAEVIKKATDAAEAATKRAEAAEGIAKGEFDRRLEGESVKKCQEQWPTVVDATAFGPVLKQLGDVAPTLVEEVEKVLTAAEEMAKSAKLFEKQGLPGSVTVSGDAWTRLDKMAEDMVVNKLKVGEEITKAEAIVKVAEEHPDIYDEYRRSLAAS